ncbi:lactonase family protein [Kitasatospora acidiphila]|uniref:lactonase family protein n=1 Tax=Kitasatospora acidiphila TaxID=2567942 RepID=UPI001E4A1D45|nr:beta-propeller fold lactonase family protein [Kitasatospora acidiphila]
MRRILLTGVAAATALAAAAVCAPAATASATAAARADDGRPHAHHAVFAQTNNPAGNQVVAYHRADDGRLTQTAVYDTGGLGGVLQGSVADHLASQGSLTYDPEHALLYAVNAGSNTVSVFTVDGDRLKLVEQVESCGTFPVSVAVHGDVVYVLNALNRGSIQGYRVVDGHLKRKTHWNRALGLDPNAKPQFTNTPGQVGFLADGSQLVVTTKANGNAIDVFALDSSGAPADSPTVTTVPGAVPFGFVPNGRHGLFLTEAGPNVLATFRVRADGRAAEKASVATGQSATCWVVAVGDLLFVSNAGSSTLTGIRTADHGRQLTLLGNTPTDPGTTDAAVSSDGHHLYVQTGVNGIIDEFTVNDDGSLTPIGSQTVPGGVGGEGIVAF